MELSSEELARRKAVIRKALEKIRRGLATVEEDAASYDADSGMAQLAYSDREIHEMLAVLFAATAGVVVSAGKELGIGPKGLAELAVRSLLKFGALSSEEVSPQMRSH